MSGQQGSTKTITGTIDDVRTLTLRGKSGSAQANTVAKVTLNDGRSFLIDFGQKRQNPSFRLNDGDKIRITGRTGTISGRRVIFATKAQLDGQNFNIQRSNQQRSASQNRIASVSGTVEDVAPMFINNESGQRQRLVKLSLENGKVCLLDLGGTRAADIGLTEGERVSVRGTRDQISGREIIRPNRMTINGEAVELDGATERSSS